SKISFNKTKPIVYINAFNSPEQLEMVIESFIKYDKRFLDKTEKVLINNSTKENLFSSYDTICDKYNFKDHIKKGNLGICRARQLAAEHFYDSSSQYMLFFEDDMLLDMSETKCSFGLNKKVDNLFDMLIRIMNIEKYDFLKLSFSEFYGHNGQQWSWHNVPSPRKEEYFGSINSKPNTKFNNIHSLNGVVYADGEIYYSNWPHIINQEGNQKCFLDTKWDNPFEQTWMSHIYSLTKQGKVKPAILLHSPITHNRVHHYEAQERKEN
ncbi:glycosyltransferase family 2 protein, partial [bacterium]|nr:glycosyltransferase family 2 protein [bacterium]